MHECLCEQGVGEVVVAQGKAALRIMDWAEPVSLTILTLTGIMGLVWTVPVYLKGLKRSLAEVAMRRTLREVGGFENRVWTTLHLGFWQFSMRWTGCLQKEQTRRGDWEPPLLASDFTIVRVSVSLTLKEAGRLIWAKIPTKWTALIKSVSSLFSMCTTIEKRKFLLDSSKTLMLRSSSKVIKATDFSHLRRIRSFSDANSRVVWCWVLDVWRKACRYPAVCQDSTFY